MDIWGFPVKPTVTLSAPAKVSLESTATDTSLSILPKGAQIEFQPDSDRENCTQVFSFRIPVNISKEQRLLGFVQDITLGITKSGGSRVLIVADLAGTVKTFEWGFAALNLPSIDKQIHTERFFSVQGLESAMAGSLGIQGPVPDYEATIVIKVQRINPKEVVNISIDALDIEAHVV